MCWKRYEPDPPPSPTPMAFFGASTEAYGAVNATEGGVKCPDEATICSTIENLSVTNCNDGICCQHVNGDQLCSCFPGHAGDYCDEHELIFASTMQASSHSMVIIGVLLVLLVIGLSIGIVLVYRWRKRRISQPDNGQQELTSRDVTVIPNSAPLLQNGDTNGNEKDART